MKLLYIIGKPSISMGHLYHGYVTNNQRVHEVMKLESPDFRTMYKGQPWSTL